MLAASARRIRATLPDEAVVLDVGGWAAPFDRADWVIDLRPHATRGLYPHQGGAVPAGPERFDASRWVQRDVCDHEPWPFSDGQFDFAVCAHTLEDLRDPVWVCAELNRVARAGYIEVPSRLEEQSWGLHGAFVGWSHHRWLCEVGEGSIEFAFKPHHIHARPEQYLPAGFAASLTPAERVGRLWWEGGFAYRERIFLDAEEVDTWLAALVTRHGGPGAAHGAGVTVRWRRLVRWRRPRHALVGRLGQLRTRARSRWR